MADLKLKTNHISFSCQLLVNDNPGLEIGVKWQEMDCVCL